MPATATRGASLQQEMVSNNAESASGTRNDDPNVKNFTLPRLRALYMELLDGITTLDHVVRTKGASGMNSSSGTAATGSTLSLTNSYHSTGEDEQSLTSALSSASAMSGTSDRKRRLGGRAGSARSLASAEIIQRHQNNKNNKIAASLPPAAMAAAWRILSATGEGLVDHGAAGRGSSKSVSSSTAERDDRTAEALNVARAIEARLIEVIRQIGEIVVYGEQNMESFSGSEIFEYFCDKNIMAMFVDIVRSRPPSLTAIATEEPGKGQAFRGVVYSAAVKGQVLQTVSILVMNVKNPTSRFYLLSNNYVNQMIMCILPLKQFTNVALEEMIPIYISFVKSLALGLSSSPDLLPFFLGRNDEVDGPAQQEGDPADPKVPVSSSAFLSSAFPVLTAAVDVATSTYAKVDNFTRLTALNIIVNLCQIKDDAIRAAIGKCTDEQDSLFMHLRSRFVARYQRLSRLTAGPNMDAARSKALMPDIVDLHDQMQFICDLLRCGVRAMNVRLCETLVREIIFKQVLKDIVPRKRTNTRRRRRRHSLNGSSEGQDGKRKGKGREARRSSFTGGSGGDEKEGTTNSNTVDDSRVDDATTPSASSKKQDKRDEDQVPPIGGDELIETPSSWSEEDATSHVSVYVLGRIFRTIEYLPFLRMVAVAVLHPLSPDQLCCNISASRSKDKDKDKDKEKGSNSAPQESEFYVTTALHDIVEGNCRVARPMSNGSSSSKKDHRTVVRANPFREELLRVLGGERGDGRFVPAAMLMQALLESKALDGNILSSVHVLVCDSQSEKASNALTERLASAFPDGDRARHLLSFTFEDALSALLSRQHDWASPHSINALKICSSLSLILIRRVILSMKQADEMDRLRGWFRSSSVIRGLMTARGNLATEAQRFRQSPGVADLFVDLMEAEIVRRYGAGLPPDCTFTIPPESSPSRTADWLIRRPPEVNLNEVESARYTIRLMLHMRSVCKILRDVYGAFASDLAEYVKLTPINLDLFRTSDEADEDLHLIGGLTERPRIGTDLILKGRVLFPFSASWQELDEMRVTSKGTTRDLLLVLDPTFLYVVRKRTLGAEEKVEKGKILCAARLRSILATATDEDDKWLHVALKPATDIGVHTSMGSMAFQFASASNLMVVKERLENCRTMLNRQLLMMIDVILDRCHAEQVASESG